MFDCGGGVFDRLIQSGRKPSDITHVFFTHLHSDHMMDYARLIHAAWDEGGAPAKVMGPAPIADITEKLFGASGVFSHDLRARTEHPASQEVWLARGGTLPRPWPKPEVSEVEPGFEYVGDGWSLKSCAVPHAQPQLTCMAFRIDAGGKSFVFSGDAALCDELESLASEADLLLHWCYRLSSDNAHGTLRNLSPDPIEIAKLATRCKAGSLVLTHLRLAMDNADSRKQIINDVSAGFDGEFCIADDLMEIIL